MSLRTLIPILAAVASMSSACAKDSGGGGTAGVAGLEARVKKLEADNAKYKAMLEMIHGQFAQQEAERRAEEDTKAAEDAVFAVDIAGNQIEGPASGAYVTIIEAWDFA